VISKGGYMSEHENNGPEDKDVAWYWKLLRHPLFVSVIATGFFGIIIAFLGDHWQHQTWVKQKEIELTKSIEGRVFHKRADILEELFYNIARREQILIQILHSQLTILEANRKNDRSAVNRFYDEYYKYSELSEELEARSSSLVTAMRVFFDWRKHPQIIPAYIKLLDRFNQIHNRILKSTKAGILSEEDIRKNIKDIDELREEFHLMFKDILYYPQITNIGRLQ
jgi:hypothetical protein